MDKSILQPFDVPKTVGLSGKQHRHSFYSGLSVPTLNVNTVLLIQSYLNSSNIDSSFTMANSNSFVSPYEILPTAQTKKQKQKNQRKILLIYHEVVCCVYSLESPHRGDSNKYTQHTIIV